MFDAVRELDASPDATVRVRIEKRRYGKRVTVLDGFPSGLDLGVVAAKLKRRLATGGSTKQGRIELQGEFGPRLVASLEELGLRVEAD